jgi:xyloglucan glycosyltransferase 4
LALFQGGQLKQPNGKRKKKDDISNKDLSKEDTIEVTRTNNIYKKEFAIALLLLTAAIRSLLSARAIHFYFLFFPRSSFCISGS